MPLSSLKNLFSIFISILKPHKTVLNRINTWILPLKNIFFTSACGDPPLWPVVFSRFYPKKYVKRTFRPNSVKTSYAAELNYNEKQILSNQRWTDDKIIICPLNLWKSNVTLEDLIGRRNMYIKPVNWFSIMSSIVNGFLASMPFAFLGHI